MQELKKLKMQQKYLESSQKPVDRSNLKKPGEIQWKHPMTDENLLMQNDKYETRHLLDVIHTYSDKIKDKQYVAQMKMKECREQVQAIDRKINNACRKNIEGMKRVKLEYADLTEKLIELNDKILFREFDKRKTFASKK